MRDEKNRLMCRYQLSLTPSLLALSLSHFLLDNFKYMCEHLLYSLKENCIKNIVCLTLTQIIVNKNNTAVCLIRFSFLMMI